MANYAIHIAIAKEYMKNHKGYNEEEFIKGTIAPDLVQDKTTTHFSNMSSKANLEEFLKKYSIKDSYYAGWFLHLIVDKKFYIEYLNDWDNREDASQVKLYCDYDIITKEIVKKYNIKFPKEIERYNIEKEGKTNYIKEDTIFEFINKIGKINIEEYI